MFILSFISPDPKIFNLDDPLLISFNLTSESVKCAINIQKSIKNIEGLDLRIKIN